MKTTYSISHHPYQFPFIITKMKTSTLLPLSFPTSFLWFLMVSSLCNICFCNQSPDHVLCLPTERSALIDLKSNLTNAANRLSSWVGKDCCSWSGVVCDSFTGHVHELHLHGHCDEVSGSDITDHELVSASKQVLGGTISPSLINLLQLRYFDLSCNDFSGSSIPSFIGLFKNLMYLNISQSKFDGEMPYQLGNLSKLHVLDLHDHNLLNNLYSESLNWLNNLKGLRYLDLGGIDLEKASDWFPVVSNLTSLQELRLSGCGLNILPSNLTKGSFTFTSLVVLDLSHNRFDGMLPGWIFSLHNLTLLDLASCYISGVNPGTNGGFYSMPFLRTLRVSHNTFVNSSLMLNGLSSLSNLRLLDVSDCDISSPILGNIQNLSLIEHVDLSSNRIVEEIPKSLSNLCNITILDLHSNNFYGNVSELLERFCECESPKLQTLDISTNELSGSIPVTIGGLSLLEILHLSNNMLNGSLPESIGRLSKLSSLIVEHNSLTGIVSETHFANLTSLKVLSIGDNKLVLKVNVNKWIPPFKLQHLLASSCILGPQFPSWIESQTDLTRLDVSNANISDTIPSWFWITFSNVFYLNMSHNNVQGKLGDNIFLSPGAVLDLSNNHLHGMLPGNFSKAKLITLDLSDNNLSGSLQQFLCPGVQEGISILNLANNNMSGVIPDCWMYWPSLVVLNLENNQFSGIIPSSLGSIPTLQFLNMKANRLSGKLSPRLLNSNSLIVIELAENELMGKIPSPIGRNKTRLRLLNLRFNKFEGEIPDEICYLRSVQILDLAHNDLSGSLPTCFTNFSVISGNETSKPIFLFQLIPFSMNIWPIATASLVTKGYTYTYSTILYLVTLLDLSGNKFSGSIPGELVGLLGLRFLNLSHNDLTGTIPDSFSQIGMLESLDLSMNHLDGNIPLSMAQLPDLNWLNVSYNNLVGRIPTGPQFQTFNELSFTGNALCGWPLPLCVRNIGDRTTDQHDKANDIDWILVIVTLVGLVVGFWIIITPLFFSRRLRIAYYHFLEKIWFKLQDFIFLLFLRLTKRCRSR